MIHLYDGKNAFVFTNKFVLAFINNLSICFVALFKNILTQSKATKVRISLGKQVNIADYIYILKSYRHLYGQRTDEKVIDFTRYGIEVN